MGEKKPILFNLELDHYQIRDLDDLRDHFEIQKLYVYFTSGTLERWLKNRGYLDELKDVELINKKDTFENVLIKLAEIFRTDSEEVLQVIKDEEFVQREINNAKKILEKQQECSEIIEGYVSEYIEVRSKILKPRFFKSDIPEIKDLLLIIKKKYLSIFSIEVCDFIMDAKELSPIVIALMLCDKDIRKLFWDTDLYGNIIDEDETEMTKLVKKRKAEARKAATGLIETVASLSTRSQLPVTYVKATSLQLGKMNSIVPAGQKVLVIYLRYGDRYGDAGCIDSEDSYDTQHLKSFIPNDGLCYCPNDVESELGYIEV